MENDTVLNLIKQNHKIKAIEISEVLKMSLSKAKRKIKALNDRGEIERVFFDGLIPEGWLLKIAIDNWKLDARDRMSLLLSLCKDNIGDVSIIKAS